MHIKSNTNNIHLLCIYVNDSIKIQVSAYPEIASFRLFNGHTQVNATDLMRIKYPGLKTLSELGEWILEQGEPTQEQIDKKLKDIRDNYSKAPSLALSM
jgi:hypothetical protein